MNALVCFFFSVTTPYIHLDLVLAAEDAQRVAVFVLKLGVGRAVPRSDGAPWHDSGEMLVAGCVAVLEGDR